MKDLAMLAEGMKRAKNIKEESRYYFTQGVLLHNTAQYLSSIEYFEKFLKIVIYLQDLKSVELAFNVIGCAYMCVGEYNSIFTLMQSRLSSIAARGRHRTGPTLSSASSTLASARNCWATISWHSPCTSKPSRS